MKKGQTQANRYMIGIVIMVLGIIIVAMIIKSFSEKTSMMLKENECRDSVLSHVQMLKLNKIAHKTTEQIPPIECPSINITIKEKDEEKIQYILADKMKTCWDNWQRGQEELFLKESTYCSPCYIIDFKHDDIIISDFNKFLIEKNVPGQKYNYMQYFSGGTNDDEFASERLMEIPELQSSSWGFRTDTKKVIMFYYLKDEDIIREKMEALGNFAAGAGIGAATGGIIVGGVAGTVCGIFTLGTTAVACATVGAKGGALVGAAVGVFIAKQIAASDYPLWMSHILLKEYDEYSFEELNCSISPGKQTNLY